jgi:hypothetical protein
VKASARESAWERLWNRGKRIARRRYGQPKSSEDRSDWDFAHGFATGYRTAQREASKMKKRPESERA